MTAPELGLLRGFEARVAGRVIDLPISVQRLVAFLALQDRPLQRLHVAGTLWFDSNEEHANASLRTTLWRLRRQGCSLVEVSGSQVALAPGVAVDLHSARRQAQRVLRREYASPADLDGLCLAGDLLPDWYEEWVLVERERFRQLRLHALDALCAQLTASRHYAAAIEVGHASVGAEPLRESSHRLLIAAYLAEGNPGEAIRHYRFFRRLLDDKLGLRPSRELQALMSGLGCRDDLATAARPG